MLTHKGRSADSGHYVSWVKQVGGQRRVRLACSVCFHLCLKHRSCLGSCDSAVPCRPAALLPPDSPPNRAPILSPPPPCPLLPQEDGQWIQFDDDKMILRKEEEVLTLSGEPGRVGVRWGRVGPGRWGGASADPVR